MKRAAPRRLVAILGGAISIAIIAGAGFLAYRSHRIGAANPMSDSVTLGADVVRIAPSVAGRVASVYARENDLARRGQLLVELDDTPYRLALEQTRADLDIARAGSADQVRNIRAEEANAKIAQEQVNRATANLELATQTLDRLLPMQPKGYVSNQQVDDARTARRDAEVSLNESMRQLDAAEALIGDEDATAATIRAREAAVAIAEHELAGTKIYAPNDGRVVGLTTSPGDYLLPAQGIFTLINTDSWFASADFTETTLPAIVVGDCATVYALADRRRAIEGKVEGIGWGVSSLNSIDLPASLPIVPKSLEWVRVQQRFPVRIRLVDPPEDLMRMGASALAIVHHDGGC